jgi:hypothetical protein
MVRQYERKDARPVGHHSKHRPKHDACAMPTESVEENNNERIDLADSQASPVHQMSYASARSVKQQGHRCYFAPGVTFLHDDAHQSLIVQGNSMRRHIKPIHEMLQQVIDALKLWPGKLLINPMLHAKDLQCMHTHRTEIVLHLWISVAEVCQRVG